MTLFDRLFGAAAVDEAFSSANTVQRMLDFEAALARAESRTGVIPRAAVEPIVSQCRADLFDLDGLADGCARAGNLAIPLVQQLTAAVTAVDPDAAQYVHWGATSQDVIDSALALQLRHVLSLIDDDLTRLRRAVLRLTVGHRLTPVVARTWMQQAVPTVLGLQFAGWADALGRHTERLTDVRRRDVVMQFGGAAGSLGAFGGRGTAVATALAEALGLPMPALSWHAHRDRIASIATTLAMLAGTLGKIARDIALQSQTEVAELSEPAAPGRGTSSTMPHKHNPLGAAVALAAAVRVPGLASTILGGMVQEHERGLGGWHAEWESLPELIRLTAGSLHHVLHVVTGLAVDAARMRANLDATGGLVYGEAATFALASHIGRPEARALVETATRRAVAEGRHLRAILAANPVVTVHLTNEDLNQLFDPSTHVGGSQDMIDRVLHSATPTPDVHSADNPPGDPQ